MRKAIRNPIWLALDTPDPKRAAELVEMTRPFVGGIKVGLEFICANGPQGIRALDKAKLPIFADVKLHDIPNTVAGAVRAMARLGVSIINVHAAGGGPMLKAAMAAIRGRKRRPAIVGVTVLTSLADSDLAATGVNHTAQDQVVRLAKLCKECGLDGIVCSPMEIAAVRAACGSRFLIVTPGVRPRGASADDQRRVMTPREALQAGASILVIGRPITGAKDPAAAAQALFDHVQDRVPGKPA
jgi:orotidine-5'-phosphate decarboxylase